MVSQRALRLEQPKGSQRVIACFAPDASFAACCARASTVQFVPVITAAAPISGPRPYVR